MNVKTAKIVIAAVLILLVCVLLWPVLATGGFFVAMSRATALNYTDVVRDGDFKYLTRGERSGTLLYRRQEKKAAVISLSCDPDSGVTEYTIPASCGDYPVVELGGYVGKGAPSPFGILVRGRYFPSEAGLSGGSFDWYVNSNHLEREYIDLVLNIGPNIQKIFADQGGLVSSRKLCVIRVYVNCDPENPAFYSENGRLYTKQGKLVEGFLYWDEDY